METLKNLSSIIEFKEILGLEHMREIHQVQKNGMDG